MVYVLYPATLMTHEFIPLGEDAFMHPDAAQLAPELDGIDTLVSLKVGTCTYRAAMAYTMFHATRQWRICTVSTFQEAIDTIRSNVRAMLLIPALHPLQSVLQMDPFITEVVSQQFVLANPPLYVATPIRASSDRSYLWCLDALLPLVHSVYGDTLPFEEVVPAPTTQEAAFYCGGVFGGAYCVTNEHGVHAYNLQPVLQLPHIHMPWHMYRTKLDV